VLPSSPRPASFLLNVPAEVNSELKLVVAAIYTNYTTRIVDDEDIEQLDSYSSGPKGDKLILQFERAG
jgi:hypothetical protein